jgi:hypothetical protein
VRRMRRSTQKLVSHDLSCRQTLGTIVADTS